MWAYIDESGNTGANLFDPDQPFFTNIAMSSPVDFDAAYQDRVGKIAASVGQPYLHASELGALGVESVAPEILDLVRSASLRFYFAFVNKPDVAAFKFYDALFDPADNPAAARHTYNIRDLRLLLLVKLGSILSVDDAKLFWNALMAGPTPKAKQDSKGSIENVLGRVNELPDLRSRQLIRDILDWARGNLDTLSMWSPRKKDRYGHLPNLFTFPALFQSISDAARDWDVKVDKIVHDRQSQFQSTLREWHSLFEGIEPETIVHFGDTPIQFPDIQNSKFEIGESGSSAGLQIADLVLWTFSRKVAGQPLGANTTDLLDFCFSPLNVTHHSFRWLEYELQISLTALMARPMTEDKLLDGMALLERSERDREQRMREATTPDQ